MGGLESRVFEWRGDPPVLDLARFVGWDGIRPVIADVLGGDVALGLLSLGIVMLLVLLRLVLRSE